MPNLSPLETAALQNAQQFKADLIAGINADKNAELAREAAFTGQAPQQTQQPQNGVTPPPAPVTPTVTTPQGNVEQASNTKLYANKFDSPEAMEEGYYQLLNYTAQLARQNNVAQPQVPVMQDYPAPGMIPGSSPGAAPRVNPVARTPVDWKSNGAVVKLADKLAAQPEDLSEFAQAIADSTLQNVDQRVQEVTGPIQVQTAMDAADRYMAQQYPEYPRFAQEMVLFLTAADPVVRGTFQDLMQKGAYVGAAQYAWAMFKMQNATARHGQLVAESQIAEGTRLQARANAAVSPSSPGTPIHSALQQDLGPDPNQLAALRERVKAGDPQAAIELRRQTFGRLMSPEMRASWGQ